MDRFFQSDPGALVNQCRVGYIPVKERKSPKVEGLLQKLFERHESISFGNPRDA